MRSIEKTFNKIKEKNNCWSSYICFVEAIKGKRYTARSVREAFNKLVEKDDYDEGEKRSILAELQNVTKGLEDDQKRG